MIKIIEYNAMYDKDIKNLLVELQEYVVDLDREKYNILTKSFREEYFKKTLKEIKENNGKMLLAIEDNKAIALIIGLIIEVENDCGFKAPKGGRVSELIVSKKCRALGIGQKLMDRIEEYFKKEGCKRVLIEVFEYNEIAKKFYEKNNYFIRVCDMMKKL